MKTADQVQSPSHLNKAYASAHADISTSVPDAPALVADNSPCHHTNEPIDASLCGWLQIPVGHALLQIARVINKHRFALIQHLYLPVAGKRRLYVGWGFLFAATVAEINVLHPNWREKASDEAVLPECVDIPGFDQDIAQFTYDSAQHAMIFSLLGQLDRAIAFARTLPAEDALEFAQALHVAEKIATMYGPLAESAFKLPVNPAEAFATEMAVRWLDQWCEARLQEARAHQAAQTKTSAVAKPPPRARRERASGELITVKEAKRIAKIGRR